MDGNVIDVGRLEEGVLYVSKGVDLMVLARIEVRDDGEKYYHMNVFKGPDSMILSEEQIEELKLRRWSR